MKPAVRRALSARGAERRDFFRTATAGVAGAAFANSLVTHDDLDALTQNVRTASKPSELKITDLRVAVVAGAPMTCPLIRLDTNQGLVGYGEVRDGANERYALSLKSRVVGENPCNVDKIFRKIKQFGGHARQAGGVCGIEMALMDLAGQGVGRAVLADARRQVPRSRPPLRRHHRGAERQGAGREAEGAHGHRHHLSEAGLRHQPAAERAGHAQHAGRLHVSPEPGDDAPVHRHRDHRQGHRLARRLRRHAAFRSSARRSRSRPTTTDTSASTAASSWRARWRSTTWRGWRTWCRGSSGT